jgi:negative regulator of flagellin synthesis FlgM
MNVNDGLHGLQEVLGVSKTSPVSAVQPQAPPASTAAAPGIQDRTEVSTAASLAHHAMSMPDVRMDKVATIQQALANGSYQVSAADVADKLVRDMTGK